MSGALEFAPDHVHVYASDVGATERWFVECLGGEVISRRESKGAAAVDIRFAGQTVFVRGQTTGETLGDGGPSRFGTDHMGVRVADLYATARELKQRGVEFEIEPYQAGPTLHAAFINGPDRLRMEIVQRG